MSERIYLTKQMQIFLMDWMECDNPSTAAEEFAQLMILEGANPVDLTEYVKKIMSGKYDKK